MGLILTAFFSLSEFLGWVWHAVIQSQRIIPWYALFHLFEGGQNGSKLAFLSFLGHFDHLKKILKGKTLDKILWICITAWQSHPRNSLREKNALKIKPNCPIFEFFNFSYTFSLNFYSKIRVSRGGVKWPPIKPNFFLATFYNICAQNKKAQLKTQKKWKSETP